MNSAYSIFKRPDLIAKGEPFLEMWFNRFQAQVDYTPNLAQEINLSRIQRYPSVRGCFNGGLLRPRNRRRLVITTGGAPRQTTFKAPSGRQLIADKGSFDGGFRQEAIPSGILDPRPRRAAISRTCDAGATFRAALPERRINVDRVSIRKGSRCGQLKEAERKFNRPNELTLAKWRRKQGKQTTSSRIPFTHADLYNRCFRYLDCYRTHESEGSGHRSRGFAGCGEPLTSRKGTGGRRLVRFGDLREVFGTRPSLVAPKPFKTVSIPSSLDRQLKDNQGGCLYEWPCSLSLMVAAKPEQSVICQVPRPKLSLSFELFVGRSRSQWDGRSADSRKNTAYHRSQSSGYVTINGVAGLGDTKMCPHRTTNNFWQKPGIGVRKSSRTQRYNGFRPDRTALRKTPCGWLSTNVIRKDHAGFVSMDMKVKVRPLS